MTHGKICGRAPTSWWTSCAMGGAVWRFTVRGDSLLGEPRLRDGTRFRDVRAARSR